MKAHVTYSARDYHGERVELLGIKGNFCFVVPDGAPRSAVEKLPVDAIDWAGAYCAPGGFMGDGER